MKKQIYKGSILLVSFVSLTGFIFGDPEAEVNQFINETQNTLKAGHKVKLPPMPVYQDYKPYLYQAGEADPFKLKPFVTDVKSSNNPEAQPCKTADCGDPAPNPHIPYFLENYDISSLRMMGVLNKNNVMTVLIRTPDAGIQEAKVGEYIGRNNGLILSIKPDHIVVQEKYKVPRGWQNRMTTLELFN